MAAAASMRPEESRLMRLLPKGRDLTLIILKGHLLVEEELNGFLINCSFQPEALDDARLTFLQKLRVVRAFYPLRRNALEWRVAEELNKLRNKISHHAEVLDLHALVDRLVLTAKAQRSNGARSRVTRADKLRHLVIRLVAFFSVLTETMSDMHEVASVKQLRDLTKRCSEPRDSLRSTS
jgi:uncharacterized protein YdcH (DUF465 family)